MGNILEDIHYNVQHNNLRVVILSVPHVVLADSRKLAYMAGKQDTKVCKIMQSIHELFLLGIFFFFFLKDTYREKLEYYYFYC